MKLRNRKVHYELVTFQWNGLGRAESRRSPAGPPRKTTKFVFSEIFHYELQAKTGREERTDGRTDYGVQCVMWRSSCLAE